MEKCCSSCFPYFSYLGKPSANSWAGDSCSYHQIALFLSTGMTRSDYCVSSTILAAIIGALSIKHSLPDLIIGHYPFGLFLACSRTDFCWLSVVGLN